MLELYPWPYSNLCCHKCHRVINERSESSVSSLWDSATSISDGIFVVVVGGSSCVGGPGLELEFEGLRKSSKVEANEW